MIDAGKKTHSDSKKSVENTLSSIGNKIRSEINKTKNECVSDDAEFETIKTKLTTKLPDIDTYIDKRINNAANTIRHEMQQTIKHYQDEMEVANKKYRLSMVKNIVFTWALIGSFMLYKFLKFYFS